MHCTQGLAIARKYYPLTLETLVTRFLNKVRYSGCAPMGGGEDFLRLWAVKSRGNPSPISRSTLSLHLRAKNQLGHIYGEFGRPLLRRRHIPYIRASYLNKQPLYVTNRKLLYNSLFEFYEKLSILFIKLCNYIY